MNEILRLFIDSYKDEKEYFKTLEEFFTFIPDSFIDKVDFATLRKLTIPNKIVDFDVAWIDDSGKTHIDKGYRVQFNNANGVYKGGLRFHPSVNLSILKMLAFEQTFKNILTGLPMGGAKGGSDFDPKGKSEEEIKRFSRAFMEKLQPYIGVDVDVPAGDIGVGHQEIRAMYEKYVELTGKDDGVLTGKPLDMGGSLCRKEATGYGLCYISQKCLDSELKTSFAGKTVIVSGSGNVSIYAAEKAQQLGATVIAMSDSQSAIYDPNGLDLNKIKKIKEDNKGRLHDYLLEFPKTNELTSKDIWSIKCDIALPCATQFEIDLDAAKKLVSNGVFLVAEGSNMATHKDAAEYLISKTLYLPGKAANAGGVAVSGFEMIQNKNKEKWSFKKVDNKLKVVMENIYSKISSVAKEYGFKNNFLVGANVSSLKELLKKTKIKNNF